MPPAATTPTIVVAGTNSGVGKTTVALGLMHVLRRAGLVVQPFKVGPDFLDGLQHARVCGAPSVNLDGWLMGRDRCLRAFDDAVAASGADVAIVEGCMGLHDGRDGASDDGSTAQVAKWLEAPVVLVVDARSLARSAAAMVHGYRSFDADVDVAAAVLNRVGGASHAAWLREALASAAATRAVEVVACLPTREAAKIEERGLGLAPPAAGAGARLAALGRLFEEHVDVGVLQTLAARATRRRRPPRPAVASTLPPVVVAVAKDAAFCFHYEENLAALRRAGATVAFFSPLDDDAPPDDAAMLYLGGGYPERHGEGLARNGAMRAAVRAFSARGGFVWAECGGLMYLARRLCAKDGAWAMAGLLPFDVTMTPRAAMGYCTATLRADVAALLRVDAGTARRCQQFHFSEPTVDGAPATVVDDAGRGAGLPGVSPACDCRFEALVSSHWRPEGAVVNGATVATYNHFLLDDELAAAFVGAARRSATVASLVPSGTEAARAILGDDGFARRVVGRSEYCDFPEAALRLPVVSRSALTVDEAATGAEVEAAMRRAKAAGTKPHVADVAWLAEHRPGVVLVQDACPACGAVEGTAHAALEAAGLDARRAATLRPTTVAGVLESLLFLGDILGESDAARRVVGVLEARLAAVAAAPGAARPRVLGLESCAPLVASGQWLPDVRIRAGGADALGDAPGAPARLVGLDEIVASTPDVVVICCCGRSARGAAAEVEEHLLVVDAFRALPAARRGNVFVVPHETFSRPGPRVVDAVETVAALLRPDDLPRALAAKAVAGVLRLVVDGDASWRWEPVGDAPERDAAAAEPVSESPSERGAAAAEDASLSAPAPRCAAALVAAGDGLLLFGGEDAGGSRLDDVWTLAAPQAADAAPAWRRWRCGKTYGEDVGNARSNHALAACGDHVLVFGGWGDGPDGGPAPLAAAELLHAETKCWTHCSTSNEGPSPRGNPTLTYCPDANVAVVYGGWQGSRRLGDAWSLCLSTWTWRELDRDGPAPAPRTDHAAALWSSEEMERVVVFGGSAAGAGATNDVWSLDPVSGAWSPILAADGPKPEPRTSHAAAIAGRGGCASLVVVGGQDGSRGSGAAAILDDVWIFNLRGQAWTRVDAWRGRYPLLRCRHAMALVASPGPLRLDSPAPLAVVFGGWDGAGVVDGHRAFFCAEVDAFAPLTMPLPEPPAARRQQDRWAAEVPFTEADLDADALAKARKSRLPLALAKAMHRAAGRSTPPRDTYIDPDTGYSVFTASYLKRRPCCGNGCRHCPWGHANVPGKKAELAW